MYPTIMQRLTSSDFSLGKENDKSVDITEQRDLWNLLPSLCEQAGRKQHVVRTEGALSRKERALSALPCEAEGYQGRGEVFSQLKTKEYV
jgi:hypothetical protein